MIGNLQHSVYMTSNYMITLSLHITYDVGSDLVRSNAYPIFM